MAKKSNKTLNSIQTLRGIAAILVMYFHKADVFNTTHIKWGKILFSKGLLGVDLFFILSGFIMMYVSKPSLKYINRLDQSVDFLLKRAIRIIPLYYLCTLLFHLVFWENLDFWTMEKVRILKSFRFEPLNSNGEAPYFGYASLIVGWTLNYEMLFYCLFAISLLWGKWKLAFFTFLLTTFLVVVPFVTRHHVYIDTNKHYHFENAYICLLTNPIVWEFLLGIIIAYFIQRKPQLFSKTYSTIGCIISACIIVSIMWIPPFNQASTHGVLSCGWSFGLVVFFFVHHEMNYGMRVPKIFSFLGKISFSLYLLHPIIQHEVKHLLIVNKLAGYADNWVYILLFTLATIGIATLTQRYIEQQLSNWLKLMLDKARTWLIQSNIWGNKQQSH